MGSSDFFYLVMEAEGEEPAPVDGGDPPAMDIPADSEAPSDDLGADLPPDMPDMGGDELDFGDDGGGTDLADSEDSSSSSSDSEDEKKEKAEEDKISTKTNNILNERLYDQMIHRNKEIEDIVDNLQKISPILPSDVVYENDKSLNQLKQALSKGKSYVIDKFINAEYGENMLFFTKLDSLYVLLMDKINSNLKGINNSSNDD